MANILSTLRNIPRQMYYLSKDIIDIKGRRRLEKNSVLYNKHSGGRIFLLLTGESLSQIDVKLLRDEITLGVGFIMLHNSIININLNYFLDTEPSKSFNPNNPNWPITHLGPLENEGIVTFYRYIDQKLMDNTHLILHSDNYKYIKQNNLFKGKTIYYIKGTKALKVNNKVPYSVMADLTKRRISGGGSVYFSLLTSLYMGFKEIYLCGAGYTYEPALIYHFYDNIVYPKSMSAEEAEILAKEEIDNRNIGRDEKIEFFKLFEEENSYRCICVMRNGYEDYHVKHRILNNYAKSQGVKIYNIVPDGFDRPVYEKISWDSVMRNVL